MENLATWQLLMRNSKFYYFPFFSTMLNTLSNEVRQEKEMSIKFEGIDKDPLFTDHTWPSCRKSEADFRTE